MEIRHLTSLLLTAAYLMIPPPQAIKGRFRIDFSAPLSNWAQLRRFDSTSECAAALDSYRQKPPGGLRAVLQSKPQAAAAMRAARCISTHDPRVYETYPQSGPNRATTQ
jgi:hypothetical protein